MGTEGEGWGARLKKTCNYYWPSQGGTFVAVFSFNVWYCSFFKCFNYNTSVYPINFVQY